MNDITNPALSSTLQNRPGAEFFKSLLPAFISFAFIAAVVIFFFTALIGAIRWITSGGDKTAVEAARGTITNAIIGLFVTFSLYAIIKIIEQFFGISILTIDIDALRIR